MRRGTVRLGAAFPAYYMTFLVPAGAATGVVGSTCAPVGSSSSAAGSPAVVAPYSDGGHTWAVEMQLNEQSFQ